MGSSGPSSSGGQARQMEETIYFLLYIFEIRIFKLVCVAVIVS